MFLFPDGGAEQVSEKAALHSTNSDSAPALQIPYQYLKSMMIERSECTGRTGLLVPQT